MVWVVAAIAILGGAWVSRIIKQRGQEAMSEAGTGDDPGSPDRGPDGMKM